MVSGYNTCPLADISESGRIAYCSLRACIRKVEWLSMEDRVPSGRGECKPVETPPAAFEAGSPRIHSWEEVTSLISYLTFTKEMKGILSYSFLDRYGNTLAAKEEELPLMPASNMKIVTGFTAYKLLGRNFEFKTDFKKENGTVKVTGDPTPLLSGPDLKKIIQDLSIREKEINRVLFQSNAIDPYTCAPSWKIGDRKFAYQAKITPFSLNEGCVMERADSDLSHLVNPHDDGSKPLTDPVKNFSKAFIRNSSGLNGSPQSKYGAIQAEHREKLIDVIKHMETVSCNFTAEILLKYIGHKTTGRKGSWKNGPVAVMDFLKDLGLDTSELVIVDGSGLSRMNLLNTQFLSNFIHKIKQSDESDFLNLLPSPGIGTLTGRLEELSSRGVHAKTGSIGYCSSLSGYIEKPGISFSIIVNNSTEGEERLPQLIDDLLVKMVKTYS